jgi:DNA modification methylase
MSDPYYTDPQVTLHLGEMLDILPTLPDASVDAVVCDPPYGLADHHPTVIAQAIGAWLAGDRAHVPDGKGFMGNAWDRFVPPPAAWDECWRVLKPAGTSSRSPEPALPT